MQNLLNKANDSKLVKRKQNIANDQLNANYNVANEIINNTEVLKSDLCNYDNAYILVRGHINDIGHKEIQVAFKNCAPFTKYITKIDRETIDNAKNLDLIMPMYNLIEYSSNYSEITIS